MLIIFIISVIMYVIASVIIYHNIYNFDKDKKIKFIVIGLIIVLIITAILCAISSSQIGMKDDERIKITRNAAILMFSPMNSILLLPYVGNILNKYKGQKINESKLKKKMIITLIVMIIVMIFEIGYFKDFQLGALNAKI